MEISRNLIFLQEPVDHLTRLCWQRWRFRDQSTQSGLSPIVRPALWHFTVRRLFFPTAGSNLPVARSIPAFTEVVASPGFSSSVMAVGNTISSLFAPIGPAPVT